MLLAHSGFVAQFIAQEIIPDGAHRPHNAKNLGGFLYEATIGSGLNPGHNPALNLQA
jgi:hypothetical protein